MQSVSSFNAKVCITSGGILIHEGKILLIKHKKLGVWLNPGGHVEDNELPHQTAEREFWEETGITVRALSASNYFISDTEQTEYLPTPIYTNIHWLNKQNYENRLAGKPKMGKGCEQHLGYFYLVKAEGSLEYKQNVEETDGIGWFTLEEVAELETFPEIKREVKLAFQLVSPSASLADAL